MPICPSCGSALTPCGCEVASWIEPAPAFEPSGEAGPACASCGYAGEMTEDDWGTRCPACGVASPRALLKPQLTQLFECPECGREIGVTEEDRGKTVVCPGCSYFLGTPLGKPGRA